MTDDSFRFARPFRQRIPLAEEPVEPMRTVVVAANGRWCVPPAQRPANWQALGLLEPEAPQSVGCQKARSRTSTAEQRKRAARNGGARWAALRRAEKALARKAHTPEQVHAVTETFRLLRQVSP